MFGSKDHLGFTADDLDTSSAGDRRRRVGNDELTSIRNGMLITNIALAVILLPAFVAILLSTTRSSDPNRWTTFWITTAILLVIALVIEMFFVMKLLRSSKDAPGVFTGDERA